MTASADAYYVSFTCRYGINTYLDPSREKWRARHLLDETPSHRCRCPGTNGRPCCQSMTEEDLQCDQCRYWCVAVDQSGDYHPLMSLPKYITGSERDQPVALGKPQHPIPEADL